MNPPHPWYPMDNDTPDLQNVTVQLTKRDIRLRGPRPEGDFNRHWYEERLERGAFGRPNKVESDDFMRRYPLFRNNRDEDAEWGPVRVLGQGGYGLVGLWEKRDENNRAEDHIVVKQETAGKMDPLHTKYYPHLRLEAVIHRDLNQKQPGTFPKLRAYKYLEAYRKKRAAGFPTVPATYRMYLEHCPHGDLEHLRKLYTIWDQPLPELFIWHVFLRLAIAGDALREPPNEDSKWTQCMLKQLHDAERNDEQENQHPTPPRRKPAKGRGRKKARKSMTAAELYPDIPRDPTEPYLFNNCQVLHGDMKPHNVLLGDNRRGHVPEDDRRSIDNPDYPLAMMSDFGVSKYTSRDLVTDNPNRIWHIGTPFFRAPEQEGCGAHWPIPPTGAAVRNIQKLTGHWHPGDNNNEIAYASQIADNHGRFVDVSFDHSLNIYGIGRTVYCLLTNTSSTREPKDHLRYDPLDYPEAEYAEWGMNRYHRLHKIRTPIAGFYTPRLRRLVWRCLDPNPANRPSQLELLEKVQHGLRTYKRRLRRLAHKGQPLPELKLFYRGHEINDMPRGQAYSAPNIAEVRRLLRDEFLNPDLPRLRLPVRKYENFPEAIVEKEILDPKIYGRKTFDEKPDTSRWFNQPDTEDEDEEEEDELEDDELEDDDQTDTELGNENDEDGDDQGDDE